MAIQRGWKARLHYRTDQFLSSGPGKQLLLLFGMTLAVVLVHVGIAFALKLDVGDSFASRFWFYFTRILDTGQMADDKLWAVRVLSTVDTVMGLVVAGLLISTLSGNFQARLDAIQRGGSPVVEEGHFLILGWSEKIYSVIDQLSEANIERGRITVVVMADSEKREMEDKLRDKVQHLERVKIVVRSGSSVSVNDLSRVAFDRARAIVVLIDESDALEPDRADGRVIKTLLAIYNHPDGFDAARVRVTAEVLMAANREIAEIAAARRAQVVKTNEMISKIILQTSRISGLSFVYDELLRFEGNEIHYAAFKEVIGRRFDEVVLEFPNGCVCGVAKADGSSHILNPPGDHVIAPDEELLILAEDDNITHRAYGGPLRLADLDAPAPLASKPVEHLLILGWNEKIFPIVTEFDAYVGVGSTLTLLNTVDVARRRKLMEDQDVAPRNTEVRHVLGEFTSRKLMEQINPKQYPVVMVLGDASTPGHTAEQADTRAIIALLLLRDLRGASAVSQKVCTEILEPKNRELAATTEIHDIVISNEMVSMVLAQITHEPRVAPVLDDLFQSEGSEIYLKRLDLYAPAGRPVTFEQLLLAARARGECALGVQSYINDPKRRFGIVLNPTDRQAPIVPKPGDRLIVLAEDDG